MDLTSVCASMAGISSLFAVLYGAICLQREKKGFYYSFIVVGFFSFAIGDFYTLLLEVTGRDGMVFSIGSLGTISGFLLISFACNTLEKVDSCEIENLKKYKLISLLVPIVFAISWVIMLLGNLGFEKMIIPTLFMLSSAPCTYYCLVNIIAPYPKNSLVRCMRPFFMLVFIVGIFSMILEMLWLVTDEVICTYCSIITVSVMCVCSILMPIFLERGSKEWTRM